MPLLSVAKALRGQSTSKATGPDNIPAVFLKECAHSLAPSLSYIANRCLKEGVFPQAWKETLVVPVPKVSSPTSYSDFRPISLLPIAGKVVEKCIAEILIKFIDPLLGENQYGFRSRRSTSAAALYLMHLITTGFSKCEALKKVAKTCAIFFDVQKAFDTVPHRKLLNILQSKFNLPSNLLMFIQRYLSDRSIAVKVGKASSSKHPMRSGVPQGSVLGPLLFISYINEVATLELSPGAKVIMFADDLVYTKPITSQEDISDIQTDVNKISDCFKRLLLTLNSSKCKVVIFSLSPTAEVCIHLEGEQLSCVPSYKYLGIEMDSKLSFAAHTNKAVVKAKRSIRALCNSFKKWVSRRILKTTINTIVLPGLFYGIEVWYPPDTVRRKQIERIQKYAARIINNNFQATTTYDDLLQQLQWVPIWQRVAVMRLLSTRHFLDGTPFFPNNVFQLAEVSSTRSSSRIQANLNRHDRQLKIPFTKSTRVEKLAIIQMLKLWNAVAANIISLPLKAYADKINDPQVIRMLVENGVLEKIAI